MREIVFEDRTQMQQKKRILYIHEAFVLNGYSYTAERKNIFKLKQVHAFKNEYAADKWAHAQLGKGNEHRRLSLLKVCNDSCGKNLWQSKVSGMIYVVQGEIVLSVIFLQILKVEIFKETAI
jgi:hypothetical protein